jgi:MFS family permease
MLTLGEQVREVAIAMFISNFAATIGAIFWGKIIDIMHWRKMVITICSAAISITAGSIYFVSSAASLMLLSGLAGFFSVGPAPATNLLVMEKSRKTEWLRTFNWTSLISAVGLVISMLAGYLWLMQHDIRSYAIICSIIAISALVLTMLLVKDPPIRTLERKAMAHAALAHRMRQAPLMFLKPMSGLSVSKVQSCMSKKEFMFFAGTGFYFLSGNLLYTPYTPFLKYNGITDSQVFLAYTILHVSKVIFLPFNHKIIIKIGGEEMVGKLAYIPRMSGIVIAAVTAFLFSTNSESILIMTFAAFALSEVGFSIWNTSITSSLFKMIPAGKEGKVLGVNSAITGAGLLIGSIAAGEVAATLGYSATFALSIGVLIASFILISRYFYKTALTKVLA